MRYFLDTEFVEDGSTIMPISLALVCDDGRELYIELQHDEKKARAHDFVRENVLPHLRREYLYTRQAAAERVAHFLDAGPKHPAESKGKPDQIWAYFASYDWVVLCQLFGTMMDLPPGCPRYCNDLVQWWTHLGRPPNVRPPKPTDAHDALADARWNLMFYNSLKAFRPSSWQRDGREMREEE